MRLQITDLHADGYGSAELDGRAVAVYGALPGETVEAIPLKKKKRVLFSRAESITDPSADREDPRCPVASICGGCSLQHLSATGQLALRAQTLQSCLGEAQPDAWLPPLSADRWGYRSKARLGVKYVEKLGRVLVGFREKMYPFIVDNDGCDVLSPAIAEVLPALSELLTGMSAHASIPQIEVAVGDDAAALVFRHLQPLEDADVAALTAFGLNHEFQIYLQSGGIDTVTRIFPEKGTDRLHYAVSGFQFSFHPMDFTQVNQSVNRQLVALAVEQLRLQDVDRVADLFCGIGNFSLPVARHCAHVLGLEVAPGSVARARENAARNDANNARFEVADLTQPRAGSIDACNKVLLDPARAGAGAAIDGLVHGGIERIVYVSCNPVSLAADASQLVSMGFRYECAGVVDMFPHTAHMESISVFERTQ